VLCFVYVGLTQRPLTSFLIMPLALLAWFVLQHTWSAVLAVRLAIAVPTWLLIAELLAYRMVQATKDQEALTDEAHTDALTGLPNRRQLDLRLADACEGDTLVMCDLDRFKALNDEWGHAAGDQVLADFGQLLKESLRGQDAAGRYGGEEFVLILTGTSPEAALDVLHRMRRAWTARHPSVTFSTGISEVSGAAPVSAALRAADEALYASKAGGRNCDHILYHQVVRASV
jgi:diguanylate cyclase (GGDEF)-like protein